MWAEMNNKENASPSPTITGTKAWLTTLHFDQSAEQANHVTKANKIGTIIPPTRLFFFFLLFQNYAQV